MRTREEWAICHLEGASLIPLQELEGRLHELDREHEIVVYDNAPHSFFDRAQEQYAEESADAWQRVLEFIETHA